MREQQRAETAAAGIGTGVKGWHRALPMFGWPLGWRWASRGRACPFPHKANEGRRTGAPPAPVFGGVADFGFLTVKTLRLDHGALRIPPVRDILRATGADGGVTNTR